MSSVTKTAGVAGTFHYTLSVVPDEAPHVVIYSDPDRTVVAQAEQTLTPTANPSRFEAVYSASLAAGTYYLGFTTVITTGEPAFADNNDTLVLVGATGGVTEGIGPCEPWATVADCSPCDDYNFPMGLLDEMLTVASGLLFELSGRRFPGICSATVRPCSQPNHSDPWIDRSVTSYGSVSTRSRPGSIQVGCGCASPRLCGCSGLSEITLGVEPIVGITEILIDGAILDPNLYRIDDSKYLVRLPDPDDSRPGWPCCQDLALDATEPDTFQVEFTHGLEPPPAGVHAAAILACELALACQPETIGECRLPRRVQSITRQEVSMVLLDPFEFLDQGRVGIIEIDLFLRTYNKNRLSRPSTVISPDINRRVRRVGT